MPREIDLRKLVIEVDDELIQEGIEPFKRHIAAYFRILDILDKLELNNGRPLFEHDPLCDDIHQIYRQLYRQSDLCMPSMYLGAFLFRDVFFPLRIPIIYGSPAINPVDLLDAPDIPKQWLFDNHQTGLTFFDQFIDLMDFAYGLDDLEKIGNLNKETVEYWYLAKQQLEAAAATLLLGSFSNYAVIQNCCISTELLLKGALMAKGILKNDLASARKGYGHNLVNLINSLANLLPSLDRETLLFVVQSFPDYVQSRYDNHEFPRIDLGNLLMNTQFISGEILRQFSTRNCRSYFIATPHNDFDLTSRTFPKK